MRKKTLKILALVLLSLLVLVPMALWTTTEIVHAEETTGNTADTPVDTDTLTPGTYQLQLSATHPETGQVFTTTRSVQLMAASNGAKFGVRYPQGNGNYNYSNNVFGTTGTANAIPLTTLAQAINFIERHRPSASSTTGTYYICLEEDYTLTSTDQAALLDWNRLSGNTIVEFRGRKPGGSTRYTLKFGSMLALPRYQNGYENSPKFIFRDIKLSTLSADAPQIIANGSNLTIESDVELLNSVGITGGGADPITDFFGQVLPDGNSGDLQVTGNTRIHLKAPQSFDYTIASNRRTGSQAPGISTIIADTPHKTITLTNLVGFDLLRITANTTLQLSASFRGNTVDNVPRNGLLEMENNTILYIATGASSTNYRTLGAIDGVARGIPAQISTPRNRALVLTDANPIRTTGNLPITLTMHGGTPTAGDTLLTFTTQNGADLAKQYILNGQLQSGVPGFALSASGNTIVLIPANISIHTTQNPDKVYYFESFAAAFNNLNTLADPNADYVLTVRKEGYELTQSDGVLISSFSGRLKSLKITSNFELTDGDIKQGSEKTGQIVTRQVNFASNVEPVLLLAPNATFTDGVTIDAIKFNSTKKMSIYACGHKLTMGQNVVFSMDISKFPILFGGGANTAFPDRDAHLIIHGGIYDTVYGGGAGKAATVRSTKVEIGANAQGIAVYGGGREAPVTGNVALIITAGSAGAPTGQRVKVVGGGQESSAKIDGSVTISITGGNSISGVDIVGRKDGTVGGKTTINVTVTNPDSIPVNEKVNIYAATEYNNAHPTPGGTEINITGGAFWGTISGGNLGTTKDGVPDSSVINLNGQVRVDTIRNFSKLNIGTTGVPASLIVSNLMDSTPYENNYNNKIGKLNLNNSVLTFTGTTVPRVGGLTLTGSNQLVTYKNTTAGSSIPLNVTGVAFDTGATLTVGATSHAAVGDEVLKINSTSVTENMVNGYLTSMNARDSNLYKVGKKTGDYKTIVLAALGRLTAVQTKVTQNTADHQLNGTAQKVSKTITFAFESRDESNTFVTSPALTEAWLSEDATPAKSGTPVNFKENGTGQWTGTVTSNFDGWSTGTDRKKYYLHYYDTAGTVGTIELDVHAPNITTGVTASRTGEGVYTFTAKVREILDIADGAYNSSGLRDMGFSLQDNPRTDLVGGTSSIATIPMTGISKTNISASDNLRYGLHQMEEISDATSNQFGEHTYQVTLSLGAQNNLLQQYGQNFTAYLFVQDRLGNVRRIDIPVSEHKLDVSIPTRIGVLVVRGGATSKTIAPAAYLYNNGTKHFTGYFTGVTYENGNPLNFVPSIDSADKSNSMSINVVDPSWSWAPHFLPTPLAAVSQQTPINLGSTNDPNANNKIGLTFEAIYDPQQIQTTSQWSVFYLSYAFKPTT